MMRKSVAFLNVDKLLKKVILAFAGMTFFKRMGGIILASLFA